MQRNQIAVLALGILLNLSAHGQTASTAPSSDQSAQAPPSQPSPAQPSKVQPPRRPIYSGQASNAPYYPGRSNSAQANSGPSLGEVARQNRDRQAAEEASGVKPKMITNKDVPQDPEGVESSRTAQPPAARAFGNQPYPNEANANQPNAGQGYSNRAYANRAYANPGMGDERAGEQWRERIEEQKSRVTMLQARIDQINAQIRARGGTVQYDQPYSRYAAQAQERVAEMQGQLDEQRHRLEMMQEAARRAGMHTSIYDP